MFDIGWTEMLVIAIVMIVVVGPKDLPRMLRTFGRTTAKMRAMAGDFRKQFDEALKEAELDDVKNLANDMRKLNPAADIRKALDPMQKAADDVRAGLNAAMAPAATPAEPAKAGPAAMPGEAAVPPPPAPLANGHDAGARPATPAPAAAPAAPSAPAKSKPAASKPVAPKKKAATSKTGGKA